MAQDRFSVESFLRRPDETGEAGNTTGDNAGKVAGKVVGKIDHWLLSAATDSTAAIHLGSLGVSVPLTEIYDGVEFPAPAAR